MLAEMAPEEGPAEAPAEAVAEGPSPWQSKGLKEHYYLFPSVGSADARCCIKA